MVSLSWLLVSCSSWFINFNWLRHVRKFCDTFYADYGNEEYHSCKKLAPPLGVDWKSINFPFSVFCPISPIRFCSTSVGCNRCYDLIKETGPIRKEKHNLSRPDDKNIKTISIKFFSQVVQHSTKKDFSKGWVLWNLFKNSFMGRLDFLLVKGWSDFCKACTNFKTHRPDYTCRKDFLKVLIRCIHLHTQWTV